MKRAWVVVAVASLALGCRSSQPTTNPFLRTTVPPPGTGQAAVVVPGEPYTPGAAPLAAPGAGPAVPIDPSAVPVTPPPGSPPVMAPPPMAPPVKNNKYAPPGGSFQYNQSSRESRKSRETQLADADEPGDIDGSAVRLEDVELDDVRGAVRQAAHSVQDDSDDLARNEASDSAVERASRFGEPVPSHARVAKLVVPDAVNTLALVGTSTSSGEPSPEDSSANATPPAATLKITAGSTDPRAVQQAQWVVKEPAR